MVLLSHQLIISSPVEYVYSDDAPTTERPATDHTSSKIKTLNMSALSVCLLVTFLAVARALPAATAPPVVAEFRDGVEFGWGPLTLRSAASLPLSTPGPNDSDDVQYGGSYGGSYGDDGYGYGDSYGGSEHGYGEYGYGESGYGYGSGDLDVSTIVNRPSSLRSVTASAARAKSTNIGALFRKNTIASSLFSSEAAKTRAAARASSTMDEVNAITHSRRSELQPMSADSKR